MNATVRAHDITDLSYFERKGSFLKRLLHLAMSKLAEIAVLVVRGTIRVHLCELAKLVRLVRGAVDFGLVLSQDGNRFVFASSNR